MKWILLFLFACLVPLLSGWMRSNPRHAPKVGLLIGLLPALLNPWHLLASPISWAMWPGYVKGLEITVIDAIAAAVILATSRRRATIRFKYVLAFYALAILVAIPHADIPMASVFYLWQFGRMALCYVAVVKLCTYRTGPTELVKGWVIGVGVQAAYAVMQHQAGVFQVPGTLGHQNALGLATNFTVLPALALLLARQRGWAWPAGPVLNLIVAVFTASRAVIGLAGASYVVVYLISAVHRWTPRKAAVGGLGLVALALAAPVAMEQLGRRAGTFAAEQVYDERIAFEHAAWLMIHDHPLGVGPNEYVVYANTKGYSAQAGVIWNASSRAANVHNSYLLVLAETGYLGLAAMILLLAVPIVYAFRIAARFKKDPRSELLIGLATALVFVAIHFKYEFAFVLYPIQYLLLSNIGLIAGVSNQMLADRRARARRPAAALPPEQEPVAPQPAPELVDA